MTTKESIILQLIIKPLAEQLLTTRIYDNNQTVNKDIRWMKFLKEDLLFNMNPPPEKMDAKSLVLITFNI